MWHALEIVLGASLEIVAAEESVVVKDINQTSVNKWRGHVTTAAGLAPRHVLVGGRVVSQSYVTNRTRSNGEDGSLGRATAGD